MLAWSECGLQILLSVLVELYSFGAILSNCNPKIKRSSNSKNRRNWPMIKDILKRKTFLRYITTFKSVFRILH